MLAPAYHVLPLAAIVRERTLPIAGRVLAHLNQRVNAADVVAEASFSREHTLINVARMLNISAREADRFIKVKQGSEVAQGALLADAGGLFARTVRAPRAGRVIAVGGGQILMEAGSARVELRAGLPGVVSRIIPERGVEIRAVGALAQGVWGNGRIDSGLMTSLIEKQDDVLNAERLDMSMRSLVILGGHVRDADTLRAAMDLTVRGLILSSLHSSLIQMARQMKYPILVLDGFGAMPMNSAVFKLLTTNAKREITVNAERFDRYEGVRPEVYIPLPVSTEPDEPQDFYYLAAGQTVRMRRPPYAGAIGIIESLRPGLSLLPSGLRAPAADVKIESGETAIVPLANLEIVG
ncbi:MAG: hypothetical protein KJZ52_00170 [Anaerolineales bacterium]|nr:hypothetical protein [Anaerolineales bacterium]